MVPVRSAEERKREILNAAEVIFCRKGYEGTSVNDILEAVDIAKGTFYYYFVSKEAVMDAIIDHHVSNARERGEYMVSQPLPVFEKLMGVIMSAQATAPNDGFVGELNRPLNAVFHQRAQNAMIAAMNPLVTRVVIEGIGQGVFNTDYPDEAVAMLVLYANVAFDAKEIDTPEVMARRIQAFIHHVELLLGAEPGSAMFLLELFGGHAADHEEAMP